MNTPRQGGCCPFLVEKHDYRAGRAVRAKLPPVLLALVYFAACPAWTAEWVYTVVPGDNLWTFSEKYLDSVLRFDDLRRMNNIAQPRRMRPGTQIRVPMDWISSSPVPATVAALTGAAVLHRASGDQSGLEVGDELFLGDRIRTGEDTSVALRFADDSEMTLYANSEIRFDHLSAHGETGMADSRMHLIEGRLDTRVQPARGPGSRFEISTPSAISAVRGTRYRAAVQDKALASSVEVLEGSVAVSGDTARELVPDGFGTRVEKGSAPLTPRELLPAPALEPLPQPLRIAGASLRWETVPGARAYRVEIASSARFATLLWDQQTGDARVTLPDFPDRSYWVRVRGIDGIGLEGRAASLEFELDARPRAPLPLSPPDGAVVRAAQPRLAWTDSDDAAHYWLEVARDAEFEDLVLTRTRLAGTQFESPGFGSPGAYFWRLASVAANGETGPAGPARSFEVRPVHERLEAAVRDTGDRQLVATWQTAAPGLSYEVQIANDRQFKDLVMSRIMEEPGLELQRPQSGSRYLRVRSVEDDGYTGPWGASQRITAPQQNGPGVLMALFMTTLLLAL